MKKKVVLLITVCCLLMAGSIIAQEAKNVFTYKVGLFEISLLAESQGQGNKGILIGATEEMMKECAPDGTFPNAMNAFLVKTPDMNVLVDAGLGRKLFDNLESVGVSADKVDVVLITHMHGDHIGGMMKDGEVMFPNAKVYISQPEHDYWMGLEGDRSRQAKNVIAAYKNQLTLFQPNELEKASKELIPGVTSYGAYGHTPGHVMFLVESDREKMLIWGDLTHAMALQMPYPQVSVTYDVDPEMAMESRKKVLEYAEKNKLPIAGMHIAFPSMGTVTKNVAGSGYRFNPFK